MRIFLEDVVGNDFSGVRPVTIFEVSEIGIEEMPKLEREVPDGSTTVRTDTAVKIVVVTTTGGDRATEFVLKLGVLRVYTITTSEVITELVISGLLEDSGLLDDSNFKLDMEGRIDGDTVLELLTEGGLMTEDGTTTATDVVADVVSPFTRGVVVTVLY